MTPNPLLKKLGYSDSDRLVIIHTDDIGMCQASIQAYKDLWEFGTISSGAVMVPCPWFPATAQMCRENPADGYGRARHARTRNGTVIAGDPSPRATRRADFSTRMGYFPRDRESVHQNAKPEAVAVEVNAQVERALAAGIDATHVDSHMGTVTHPNFVQSYLQAGMSRMIPNMLPRASAKGFDMMGVDESALAVYAPILQQLEAQGIPMLDGLFSMPLEHDRDHIGVAKKLLGEIPTGITHFLFHPSIDTPELRSICPDWKARVANYHAFMSAELKTFIQESGIKLIGYRAIREAMRKS